MMWVCVCVCVWGGGGEFEVAKSIQFHFGINTTIYYILCAYIFRLPQQYNTLEGPLILNSECSTFLGFRIADRLQ